MPATASAKTCAAGSQSQNVFEIDFASTRSSKYSSYSSFRRRTSARSAQSLNMVPFGSLVCPTSAPQGSGGSDLSSNSGGTEESVMFSRTE